MNELANLLNANAGAVQGATAVVIAVLTAVLVGATIYYARETRKIAESTRASVQASREAVAESQRQQRLSKVPMFKVEPVRLIPVDYSGTAPEGTAQSLRLSVLIQNISNETALSIRFAAASLEPSRDRFECEETPLPVIGPGEEKSAFVFGWQGIDQGPEPPRGATLRHIRLILTYRNIYGHPFTFWAEFKHEWGGSDLVVDWERVDQDLVI